MKRVNKKKQEAVKIYEAGVLTSNSIDLPHPKLPKKAVPTSPKERWNGKPACPAGRPEAEPSGNF